MHGKKIPSYFPQKKYLEKKIKIKKYKIPLYHDELVVKRCELPNVRMADTPTEERSSIIAVNLINKIFN